MSEQIVQRVDPESFVWSSATGPAADVRRITEAADTADGVANLNESALLRLRHRGLAGGVLHLGDGGYALGHGEDLDLVVHPDRRGTGLGTALATAALAGRGGEVDAWSHSDHPAAARIADRFGLRRVRELWVMKRPLDQTLAPVEPPGDYRVRSFRPDDEDALLEVNALAFSHHPEQGQLSHEDFAERRSEPWFDAEGLFLAVPSAETDQRVLGFHWTKVHPEGYGEVYVVAVHPDAAGHGIGKVLTAAGLIHLREMGLPYVILYVDGDNAPAIAVYRGAGFEQLRVEAQYRGVTRGADVSRFHRLGGELVGHGMKLHTRSHRFTA